MAVLNTLFLTSKSGRFDHSETPKKHDFLGVQTLSNPHGKCQKCQKVVFFRKLTKKHWKTPILTDFGHFGTFHRDWFGVLTVFSWNLVVFGGFWTDWYCGLLTVTERSLVNWCRAVRPRSVQDVRVRGGVWGTRVMGYGGVVDPWCRTVVWVRVHSHTAFPHCTPPWPVQYTTVASPVHHRGQSGSSLWPVWSSLWPVWVNFRSILGQF